jgi:hypothetical protein
MHFRHIWQAQVYIASSSTLRWYCVTTCLCPRFVTLYSIVSRFVTPPPSYGRADPLIDLIKYLGGKPPRNFPKTLPPSRGTCLGICGDCFGGLGVWGCEGGWGFGGLSSLLIKSGWWGLGGVVQKYPNVLCLYYIYCIGSLTRRRA